MSSCALFHDKLVLGLSAQAHYLCEPISRMRYLQLKSGYWRVLHDDAERAGGGPQDGSYCGGSKGMFMLLVPQSRVG